MKNNKKIKRVGSKMIVLMCTLIMSFQLGAVASFAAPVIQKAKYDKNGTVEVDFRTKVQYKNLKVTVKDSKGKAYTARITEKDNDELEFVIKNYKENENYTYYISGVRASGETKYSTVKGTVKIPKTSTDVKVKRVSCDIKDREVEFELNKKVTWNKPVVKITNGPTTYTTKITDRDNDEIEVYIKGLAKGKTYNYVITGVYAKGTNKALTLKGTFKA